MPFDSLVDSLVSYAVKVVAATVSQILILLGPGIILALMMNSLSGYIKKRVYWKMGSSKYLAVFGWLGTVVHELGHFVACKIFGHRVLEVKWFDPDAHGGSLGYVRHNWDRDDIYQGIGNFFIGIGPILLGSLVIYYASRYLMGPQLFAAITAKSAYVSSVDSFGDIWRLCGGIISSAGVAFRVLFSISNFVNWKFYLFLYVTFAVGSSVSLSKPDVEGALSGFGALVVLILVFNTATIWFGDFAEIWFRKATQYYAVFYAVMAYALIVHALAAIVIFSLTSSTEKATTAIRNRRRRF